MARRIAKLPARNFVRLRGSKIEFAVGLLLTSFLQARAAEASTVDNLHTVDLVPQVEPVVEAKLPEWLANIDADALEQMSPEELKALLGDELLAQLGLDPELFAQLLDGDLEEAIRQLEAAFRDKLELAAAQAGAGVENGEIRAAATDSDGSGDEAGAALGEGIPLLWVIGGLAAVGGVGYALLGGDSNEDPEAVSDSFTTNEDAPLTFDVRSNDKDGDGDSLVVTHINGTAITTTAPVAITGGSVSLGADGRLTFTPNANFNGSPSFTYTVSDGNGGMSDATVALTVTAVNDAPVAVADTFTTNEDTAVTINVRGNDTDVEGNTLTVTQVNGAAINATTPVTVTGGVVSLVNGSLVFTPNANFNGTPSFTYTVNDGNGGTSTATVSGTVVAVNDAPVNTVPGAITLAQNGSVAVAGLSVADVDGGTGAVTTKVSVQFGNLTVGTVENGATVVGSGTGEITLTGSLAQINATLAAISYAPNAGYAGADSLVITTTDAGGLSDTDTLSLTVARVQAGIVQDGYIEGAQVFYDADGDGQYDEGEPIAFTNAQGQYSLALPEGATGSIIALGGVNIDTGLPNVMPLKAPIGSSVVNPLSTLVAELVESGVPVAAANAAVAASLGLPEGTDLTNFDFLDADNNAEAALAVQKAATQIAQLVTDAVEAGVNPAALVAAISQMTAGGAPMDLTAPAALTSVLVSAGASAVLAASVATAAAAVNKAIQQATSPDQISNIQEEFNQPGANLPVLALDDEGETALGGTVLIDLTGNDVDPEGNPLRLLSVGGRTIIIGQPIPVEGGSVVVGADGQIAFTAAPGFVGETSFEYTVDDGSGGVGTATVTVDVSPEGPVASVDAADFAAFVANADALAAAGVTTFDIEGDALSLTEEQAGALLGAGIDFADSDVVTIEAAGTELNTTLKGLQDLHVDQVSVSGRTVLSLDVGAGGLAALDASDLPQFDVAQSDASLDVTLNLEAGSLGDTDVGALAGALASAGVDHLGVIDNGSLSINAAQAEALAGAGLDFRDGADISLAVGAAGLGDLDAAVLGRLNVDEIDVTGDIATISDDQASALLGAGIQFADDDSITVEAAGTQLNTSLKGLQDLHVDQVATSSRTILSIDAGQGGLAALDASDLPQFDVAQSDADLDVTLNVEPGDLGSGYDLAALASSLVDAGIDHLGVVGDGSLSLTYGQAQALAEAGLDFDARADVTLSLGANGAEGLDTSLLGSLNVDHIDATGAVVISDDQALDLVNAGIDFATSETVTVEASGTQLSTSLKGLQELHVDAVQVGEGVTKLSVDAGDLSGMSEGDLPQFDTAQTDASLDVTLRVDLDAIDDLARLAGALRGAGIDNFAISDFRADLDAAMIDRIDAISAATGIDFVYGVQTGTVSAFSAMSEITFDHGQVYRELISTFESTSADAVGDIEIADGTASSLIESGMLRAYLSDNLVVDATGSGDKLLTTLKEISEFGIDEIRTADQGGAPVYVDLGIQGDAGAVGEIQTLFKNLDLNGPDKLFTNAEKVGLVLDADTATALSKVDGAFDQLAELGFTEVDVLAAPNGFSLDTGSIEVKLIGQQDDLYQHLHHER